MARLALLALLIVTASCSHKYTCSCNVNNDPKAVTQNKEITATSFKRATQKCVEYEASLNPQNSVVWQKCSLN
ncbi:MAG: hypothetical protein JST82_05240 [Bacteroidetes bacterium]|nr:hypothetical protein [Bacteroidota bacterium]